MSANTTHGHVREHESLLARVEKRTLVRIAERLPRAINSDHLSALGLAGMALAGGAYWASHWFDGALVVVVAALAVNWFGDSLDGTVARVRNQQRPMYGFYVDHVIDVAGAVLLFGGLGLSPYMTLEVALALTVAYLMISAEAYLATHARGVFRMAMFKVGPTELRILLAFGTLYLYYKPTVVLAGSEYLLFDVGGVVATAGMAGTFVLSAVRNALALYRAEPIPRADQPDSACGAAASAQGTCPRGRQPAGRPARVGRPNAAVQGTCLGHAPGPDRRWRDCRRHSRQAPRSCIRRPWPRGTPTSRPPSSGWPGALLGRALPGAGLRPGRGGRTPRGARRRGPGGANALARPRRPEDRCAEGRDPPLARQHSRSRRDARRRPPRRAEPAAAGGPAGRRHRVARPRARCRPRPRLPQAPSQEVRHRALQHGARDALRAARCRARVEPQRGDADCRARGGRNAGRAREAGRRRPRVPLAPELLLALRGGRRRRDRRVRVDHPQPVDPLARALDGEAADRERRPRVDGAHADVDEGPPDRRRGCNADAATRVASAGSPGDGRAQ